MWNDDSKDKVEEQMCGNEHGLNQNEVRRKSDNGWKSFLCCILQRNVIKQVKKYCQFSPNTIFNEVYLMEESLVSLEQATGTQRSQEILRPSHFQIFKNRVPPKNRNLLNSYKSFILYSLVYVTCTHKAEIKQIALSIQYYLRWTYRLRGRCHHVLKTI